MIYNRIFLILISPGEFHFISIDFFFPNFGILSRTIVPKEYLGFVKLLSVRKKNKQIQGNWIILLYYIQNLLWY